MVADQAAKVRTGWSPDGYPKSWPNPDRIGMPPPGTAPFTPRVEREIAKRKQKIKQDVSNAAYLHYPKEEVMKVLKFWNVGLDQPAFLADATASVAEHADAFDKRKRRRSASSCPRGAAIAGRSRHGDRCAGATRALTASPADGRWPPCRFGERWGPEAASLTQARR